MSERNEVDARSALPEPPVILVTGAAGQVGFEAVRALQGLGTVVAVDRSRLDLTRLDQVRDLVREVKPALIVNAAAYTAVDRAQADAETAQLLNAGLPRVLAEEAARLDSLLIHYSTDYVFDGTKAGCYVESDEPNPLNVYGHTKLAGEQAIAAVGGKHLVFRTSWVYGARGRNFMLTMLRLAKQADASISVVDDQVGAPTWSATIAALSAAVVARYCASVASPEWWCERSGVYHLTAGGATSWYGFACAVFEAVQYEDVAVTPIATSDYPTPARRPANSRLNCDKLAAVFGLRAPDWRESLALCLQGYRQAA
ncbi:dTDP-4-dehydrorhamnose reductase [Paraburkholderia sp. J12]|uniref:dTDP-4-dehydrorhamnose reductase n=1 Tax=Paraburkholderia sp. J12 TaxID=2805432 RepID=UPI002ABE33A9|nr:dTDP-4-dehydrorhamnose reductase [Paraburkholderia sp. J12]